MMPSAQKGPHNSRRFKWQWRSESSLTSPLINDVPPEIELSDYRRLPSSGRVSPSGLLHGEGSKAEPIVDLDLFFHRLYNYYCEKGLRCIRTKWIVEISTVFFMVFFIGFFLLVVDWHALFNMKCGVDAVESGQKPCDLAEAINHHPFVRMTWTKYIIVGCMIIVTMYGLFIFVKFFVQFPKVKRIRHFYYNSLNVTDREIQTTPWPDILEKVVQLQNSQQLCVVKTLSEHDITMRIMRKPNYLIGMINKGVLAFSIPGWVPGAGPYVSSRTKKRLVLTKTLEWALDWCIFDDMFDSKFHVRSDFVGNPHRLKSKIFSVGLVSFGLSIFLVIFMLVYHFLRHAEQFYNKPSIAFFRRWSNLSKWIFREYNEVDHLFNHRLDNSVAHALYYLQQFPSPLISTIAKFVAFVSGGLIAVLVIIMLFDESLAEGHIFGHKLIYYAAILGVVSKASHNMVSNGPLVFDPKGAMSLVVQKLHYMPKRWRGKENSEQVRVEFETLFQYTGMTLLEELASILVTPFLLTFVVPKRVDEILRFISDFTVDIEGVGHVCSLSVFDFERHGNKKYASPFDTTREQRSSQGKMEKSFLSFQSTYKSWVPDPHGQQLLSTLSDFRDRQMHQELSQRLHTDTFQSGIHDNRGFRSPDLYLDPIGMSNPDQRPYPYLLDWYYMSQPQRPLELEIIVERPGDTSVPTQNLFLPRNRSSSEIEIGDGDDIWGSHISDRMQSHFEASTSDLRNDLPQHLNPEHLSTKHWWARPDPQSSPQQASFLEPPVFDRRNFSHPIDDVSVSGSVDGQDEHDIELSKRKHIGIGPWSSVQHASFREPPLFVNHNFSHQTDDESDNGQEGGGNCNDFPLLPKITNIGISSRSSSQHASFLEPRVLDDGQEGGGNWNDFPLLPKITDIGMSSRSSSQHASFLEPRVFRRQNFSHHRDDVSERSVDGGGGSSRSSAQHASFLEPRVFGRLNFRDDVSEKSMDSGEGGDGGGGVWKNYNKLSKTMYIGESDDDDEINLHFADDSRHDEGASGSVSSIFGNPLSIPVRILPRSNDPVYLNKLL